MEALKNWMPAIRAIGLLIFFELSSAFSIYTCILANKLYGPVRSFIALIDASATAGELSDVDRHGFQPKIDTLNWFESMSAVVFVLDILTSALAVFLFVMFFFARSRRLNTSKRKMVFFLTCAFAVLIWVQVASSLLKDFGPFGEVGGKASDEVATLMLDGVGKVCSEQEDCHVCQQAVAEITTPLECTTFTKTDMKDQPYEYDPFDELRACRSPSTGTEASSAPKSCTTIAIEMLFPNTPLPYKFTYIWVIARGVAAAFAIWWCRQHFDQEDEEQTPDNTEEALIREQNVAKVLFAVDKTTTGIDNAGLRAETPPVIARQFGTRKWSNT
uniref:Uncharacterized protein n=1 Tax=Plectus sambesii TaxID=2011161 RepID=A0A914WF16_9BILA